MIIAVVKVVRVVLLSCEGLWFFHAWRTRLGIFACAPKCGTSPVVLCGSVPVPVPS